MSKGARLRGARLASKAIAASAILGSSAAPALAQYSYLTQFTYLPYTLSNSLLWPLRNAMYLPYNYSPGIYPTNSPFGRLFYRGNNYGQNTTSQQNNNNAQQNNNGSQPQSANPTVQDSYVDAEPLSDPRQRKRQHRQNQKGVDQIAHARWTDPQLAANGANSQGVPPTAPARGAAPAAVAPQNAGSQPGMDPSSILPSAKPLSAPPLASGFIDTVNKKFDGDISKALFDPEARGWARSVGLIPDNDAIFASDLSPERVEVIRKILKDPALDSVSKLDAAKILLRNSSAAPSK
ncbi:MAG TPA: hypothetical protein V6C81_26950 [Planktothrix sp.]